MTDEQWRERARDLYEGEDCNVYDTADVSPAEDGSGAWVTVWAWVPAPDVEDPNGTGNRPVED